MHADPDRPAFSAAFDSAAAALHDRIPRLSNDRILVELERLVVLLGDGHSGIYGPDPDSPVRFEAGSLPVLFYEFDDGLHIIDAVGDARRWIGSRVLRFGPRPAEDVLRDLSDDVHQDNAMTVKWLGVRFRLPGLAFLHAVGATDGPTRVLTRHSVMVPAPRRPSTRLQTPPASPGGIPLTPRYNGPESSGPAPPYRLRGPG